MATHALGKLKFNLSKQGLAYRWGDGQTKHLFGGKKAAADDADNNEYRDDGAQGYDDPGYDDGQDYQDDPGYDDRDYADDGYDDRYQDDGYNDDGYDNGGYDDDRYPGGDGYDDGYDDDGYRDDGYDDDYRNDDGYDDGYQDDDGYRDDDAYYDDQDGRYDDRYSDADAGEDYVDEYPENTSPLMQYVEENDWVTYLLLFLFPPLGIYLLWKRNKFDRPVRIAITVASAIWFIVALVLIFSSIFGAPQDATQEANITLAPNVTPAVQELDTDEGATDEDSEGQDITVDNVPGLTSSGNTSTDTEPTVEPSPTPLTGGSGAAVTGSATTATTSAYVYSPATGLYYHSRSDCPNIAEGVSVTRVPRDVAENNRKQSACPECIGGGTGETTTYYATRTGQYYHLDRTCSGMTDAAPYTQEAAEKAGKTPCPVCVTKTAKSIISGDVKFITSKTTDKSKISVYSTKSGKYYHMTATCSGMSGAKRGSLRDALLAGKSACPTCCKAAGTSVYCTKDGKFYHTNKTCSGMKDALEVTLAEALVLGKSRCHTCVKSGSLPTASQLQQSSDAGDDGTYVYGTANGKYYHTDASCSGMKDAQRYTLKSMLLQKRQACPKCASAADTVVYATKSGRYYHSYATCSGMTTATPGSMAEAISQGYKRCPKCWSESTSMSKARGKKNPDDPVTTDSGDASSSSSSTTSKSGSGSSSKSKSGSSSSSRSSSSSSSSSKKDSSSSATSTVATAKNTYVYATRSGSYYHVRSNCSGMRGASRITLKQAINAGKKACPNCAASSKRTVYSTSDGKYYHAASSCKQSGMKNGKAKTLQQALMQGQSACKYCIGRTSTNTGSAAAQTAATGKTPTTKEQQKLQKAAAKLVNSHTYKNGRSGIKVYARADSKHYHRNSTCGGMTNASRITLETAMNYGKTACPKCCASARRTVYATSGGKYYHNSREHAGSGAKKGTLAAALASGYKACPYCVTKTKSWETTGGSNTYKSGTSGIKVYATVSGKYYHSKSDCGDMKNASRISLETAMNYGKKPCPKCMATASKKVYSSSGDKYYHYYKAHAGSGAKAGTLAQARALGKKVCPKCSNAAAQGLKSTSQITAVGSDDKNSSGKPAASYREAPSSTVSYSAPADTSVYVDLGGTYYFYYHANSRCSQTKMSSGTKITLEYAKEWQYKACPYCNPPTSIK